MPSKIMLSNMDVEEIQQVRKSTDVCHQNYLPYITLVIMLLELRCTVYGENNEIVKPLKGCKVFLHFCQQRSWVDKMIN
jgi:hypothetical protein